MALAAVVGQIQKRGELARHGAVAAGKRQAHHRVFQPFAFVDGDDFDQVGIAFEADDLLVTAAAFTLQLLAQPTDQRLLAFQLRAGDLQQLGQVQKVGQAPLTIRLLQPTRGQIQLVQSLAQHGQHALRLPDMVQRAQLLAARVQHVVVGGQAQQFVQRQADGACRQTGAHAAHVQRLGHGVQPVQQVLRFAAVKHRIFVRQIHRRHAAPAQFAPHRLGFFAGAHQHGNIGGAQALQGLARFGKTGLAVVQPGADALGAQGGEQAPVVFSAAQLQIVRQGQRGHRAVGGLKVLGPATGAHGHKGQGVVGGGGGAAKAESASTCTRFGLGKAVVDGIDQCLCRAVVGAQHIVAPRSGAARGQVAVNVGTTKAVDGLLGIANQQQRGVEVVVCGAIELLKQAVLQR